MKKFKIFRTSKGGFFLSHEEDLCKAYCEANNCTYSEDYICCCV